jgi:hypothetical protein
MIKVVETFYDSNVALAFSGYTGLVLKLEDGTYLHEASTDPVRSWNPSKDPLPTIAKL